MRRRLNVAKTAVITLMVWCEQHVLGLKTWV
jgi:hypothetical protein